MLGDLVSRLGTARISAARMEERLEINEERVLSAREEVVGMEISGVQEVEQRETAPLPAIEASNLFRRLALARRHILHPAIPPAIEHPQRPERRSRAPAVQPLQKLLEVRVHGE